MEGMIHHRYFHPLPVLVFELAQINKLIAFSVCGLRPCENGFTEVSPKL